MARQLGLTYVPKCKTFKDTYQSNIKGAVVGSRRGYLVALALTRTGNNSSFSFMVRYLRSAAAQQIQDAIKAKPGFSAFTNRKTVKATEDRVQVSWVFALKKPKPQEVLQLLDAAIDEVSRFAPAFQGKCEDCGVATVNEITLMDGTPGLHCGACQSRITAEKEREAAEYRAKDSNYGFALAGGMVAAAIVGATWGELISLLEVGSTSWSPKLHMFITFLLGIPVSWVVFKCAGKRDRTTQIMAVFLTLAAKWWGDSLYYTNLMMHFRSLAFTWPLLTKVISHFFVFKFSSLSYKLIFGADLLFSGLLPWMPWGKIPRFVPVFQPLNSAQGWKPAETRTAAATS